MALHNWGEMWHVFPHSWQCLTLLLSGGIRLSLSLNYINFIIMELLWSIMEYGIIFLRIKCPFFSSILDSSVIKTLERHFITLSECLSNALITEKSNLDERNGQLIRGSYFNTWLFPRTKDSVKRTRCIISSINILPEQSDSESQALSHSQVPSLQIPWELQSLLAKQT